MYQYQVENKRNYSKMKNKKNNYIKIASLIIVFLFFITFAVAFSGSVENHPEYTYVNIKSGQTLWEIARQHNYNNQDIRKKVFEIKKANNLEDVVLQPGQQIKIPLN